MKNIFRIFKYDLKKIHKNVIAMIVIMGITIIPTLYAWFNIAASWDPYGNTGNLKVAVASSDEGYTGELLSVNINLGDQVLTTLHSNSQLDWTFTSSKKAKDGVKSGKYYAAIVIPKDFSKDMMSIFSSNVTHPEIKYYINEKENAIAPKVTVKGANAVQEQINDTFIKTVTQTALEAFQLVSNVADNTDNQTIADNLSAALTQISTDLSSAAGTVQSFSDMANSAAIMLNTTTEFLNQSGSGTKASVNALSEAGNGIDSLNSALTGTTKSINQALSQSSSFYNAVSTCVGNALDSYNSDAQACSNALTSVSGRVQNLIDGYQSLENSLTGIVNSGAITNQGALDLLNKAISDISSAKNSQIAIRNAIQDAATGITSATANATELKKNIDNLIAQSNSSISTVKKDYENNVKSSLDSLANDLTSTGSSITSLLGQLDNSLKDISGVTGSAAGNLTDVQKALSDSASLLNEASGKMSNVANAMLSSDDNGIQLLTSLLSEDPEAIGSFLASPVELKETHIYPTDNYGSAMAPFYSTLAIWVGAVVMAAMLKVTVSDNIKRNLKNPKEHQLYIGRLLLLLCIGFLQSALICLGDLYFLGIQCEHPALFVVAGCFSSLVYVNIIYALTVSFGDIGKAIAVVIMVMQVAGSGGTFPIQCAPAFFQKVYPLLPFVHSMNAMRECIAGFYGMNYWIDLGKLALFLIPSLLLGLVLRKPIIKMNDSFTEKLESTHLI